MAGRKSGWVLAAMVAAAGIGAVRAQDFFGQSGDTGGGTGGRSSSTGVAPAAAPAAIAPTVLRVPGFDRKRDVAGIHNSMGHCYGISVMIARCFHRLGFTSAPGVPLAEWRLASEPKPPLLADAAGLEAIRDQVFGAHKPKLTVGGFQGLRDFTRPGTPGAEAFLSWVDAIHSGMQDGNEDLRTVWGMGPAVALGFDVNRGEVATIRRKILEGRPVPVALMPKNLAVGGHEVLAFALVEGPAFTEIVCHDPNRDDRGGFAPLYLRVHSQDGRLEILRKERRPDGSTVIRDDYASEGWAVIRATDLDHPFARIVMEGSMLAGRARQAVTGYRPEAQGPDSGDLD